MKPNLKDVERAICVQFNLTSDDLHSVTRVRRIARPRQIAMYLARQMTGASLPQIGRYWAKDHTTVLHALRRINALKVEKPKIAEYVIDCGALVEAHAWVRHESTRVLLSQPLVMEAAE